MYEGPNFAIGVMLTQLSILFLYRRVFTTNKTWFRNALCALGFVSLGVNISVFFTIIFACKPVNFAWNKTIEGHCFEVRVVYLIHTIMILVLDICIVAAPMPIVWGLHTTSRTKGAVAGLFLLGGLSVFTLN